MEFYNPTARHLQHFISRAIGQLPEANTLLDAGCGMGVNLREIHREHPDLILTGSDISPDVVSMAGEYLDGVPHQPIRVLDLAQGSLSERYDIVLCNQVLEHIEDDDAAMRNLTAMCEKYLIITVPGGRYNSTSELVGHFRHYTREMLTRLVENVGFEILLLREWGFPFHSLYKLTLSLLPKETQKQMGFGRYGVLKRMLSHTIYLLYFANLWDKGANVLLVARRPQAEAGGGMASASTDD